MSSRSFQQSSAESVFTARVRAVRAPRTRAEALPALDDQALIHSIAAGDQLALAELYERLGAIAYGLSLRVARDPSLAEEAVQDAFLSVWRSAARFDRRRGSARTWLLTLVHRRAVDLVKRSARRPEDPTDAPPEQPAGSAAEAAGVRDERRRVQTALEGLPARQRQALELAYYGGYSQSEIAGLLGLPVGTIKSRMYVGLSRLRDLLRERD